VNDQLEIFRGENRAIKKGLIRSVSTKQDQILQWIMSLYCPNGFDLDPTYGAGGFYRKIPRPKYCFDLSPRLAAVGKADARFLPIKSKSLRSIIFDPPFLARGGENGIMNSKYGAGGLPDELWSLFYQAMCEFVRVLKPQGVLVFKCQDYIYGRTQYMSHVEIMNYAVELGLYPKDIFILISFSRPISWNHSNQNHARKFHSYFWVFGKQKRSVGYSRDPRVTGTRKEVQYA